jgi:hypothetical protein
VKEDPRLAVVAEIPDLYKEDEIELLFLKTFI